VEKNREAGGACRGGPAKKKQTKDTTVWTSQAANKPKLRSTSGCRRGNDFWAEICRRYVEGLRQGKRGAGNRKCNFRRKNSQEACKRTRNWGEGVRHHSKKKSFEGGRSGLG